MRTSTTNPHHRFARERRLRSVAITVLVVYLAVIAVLVGLLAYVELSGTRAGARPAISVGSAPIGEDDGAVADDAALTMDSDVPAITGLSADLRAAMTAASAAAAEDGQPIYITSGWRSIRYQQQLFDEAVELYASEEIAHQYVATPELSAHTTGDAVDVGPLDAQLWLQEHGYEFGLCQIFANERWHYELATTPGGACPDMLTDASELGR